MKNSFEFNDLFIFDLANNHQGDLKHALKIVREIGEVVHRHKVRGVFKLQVRQLDSFIHPAHRDKSENRHIHRFLSTRLDRKDFQVLLEAVRKDSLLAMCTPFDEESVDIITQMAFDLIKVASCSAKDWPLLEKISDTGLPIVFSTGGLGLKDIDNLVSFLTHRGCEFAIMHCVSLYPIPIDKFQLDQIDVLRNRYPEHVIGWSTHESPEQTAPVQIAVGKRARIFERHVGIPTANNKLNPYSSTPEQVDHWIAAYQSARLMCGGQAERPISPDEIESLDSLRRGVFANQPITVGQPINRDLVYFAMPYQEGQLDTGNWKPGIIATANVAINQPVMLSGIQRPPEPELQVIKSAVHDVKALLNEARIKLNSEFEVEYSHHYGIPKFRQYGVVLINCINREYCKKLLVQLPGQRHPLHHHKLKEETFQVLHGELHVSIDGIIRLLKPGETCLVLPGVWHSFWSETGAVFEEISTTHYKNDSVYKDKVIQSLQEHERKTVVDHWGRYQLFVKAGSSRET